jgi:uncharacterized protein (TIGR01619 family)
MSTDWDFYFAKVNDEVASLLVDLGIHDDSPDASKPWLLWVWVHFNMQREDGLSHSDEAESLYKVEDALNAALSLTGDCQYVGRITTEGRREFYYYAPQADQFEEAVGAAMQNFNAYQWESGAKDDPEWSLYFDLLYPTPRDWQRIRNRRTTEQLEAHGDTLTQPRLVFHWAYFVDETAQQKFVTAVTSAGFKVTKQDRLTDVKPERPFSVSFEMVHHVDLDSLNNITLPLMQLAKDLGGDYDGWETSVES